METKFNFKSAICTSRSQSERLLALGLKKETVDCHYPISMLDGQPCDCIRIGNPSEQKYHAFPAWSLHRLIEMRLAHDPFAVFQLNNTENAFEKACKWIKANMPNYINFEEGFIYEVDMADDFRKAMEE